MLKLVPFNSTWISHDKCDLHAIYRRPRFVKDEYDEPYREYDADGNPSWDVTGPLPIKQHAKWTAKGFEYVTLATRDDLITAYRTGTLQGGSVHDYAQNPQGGPWHYKKYAQGTKVEADDRTARLRDLVRTLGPAAAEQAMRVNDPGFVLPKPFWAQDVSDEPTEDAQAVAEAQPVRRGPGRPRKTTEAVA